MDELLSEIKKEYEEKDKQNKLSPQPVEDKRKLSSGEFLGVVKEKEKSSDLDSLLANVKSEFEEGKDVSVKNHRSGFDSLLSEVKSDINKSGFSPSKNSYSASRKMRFGAENKVFAEIREEIKEQEQQEEVRQEKLRQQQLIEIEKQAESWLKQLDVDSEEGLWFEEFAYAYPSKLAAAIDYLKALQK